MQKIKNIILDYGNVIFMIDFPTVRQSFIALGITNVDDFFAHHGQDSLFDAFDRGEISIAAFRQGVRDKAHRQDLSDEQIDQAWNSLLIGVPEGKHELLLQLKEKYRLFLLSNNNALHYEFCMKHIQDTYGVPDNSVFFEKAYYSHLMGKRKPDPAIFQQVIDEQHIVPEETLFIDDSPQHLASAEAMGFQTALCTETEDLAAIIKKLEL
ncbi:HAD family hydrolase [Sphingobacterium hungaricum]|uniref:HAD family phosphatase n=1 Tax=Sphingobacterium hungaricum TaxID=2082723 RepID=A0A928UXJ6_9SPHI|nr:HAD family phosphatase [Sphingobacterium hungaricum]MBE8715111.1 HAD family phosphatase [Sphingobacterium hungaricum]